MTHSLVLLVEPITPGEERVLDRLAEGESNRQIAVNLFLSERTVRDHIGRMMGKLQVKSRLQLVLSAQELGLVESPETLSAPALGILALLHAHPEALAELESADALHWGNGVAELLVACEALIRMVEKGDYYNDEICDQAKAAMAKARGGLTWTS